MTIEDIYLGGEQNAIENIKKWKERVRDDLWCWIGNLSHFDRQRDGEVPLMCIGKHIGGTYTFNKIERSIR